MRDEQQQSLSQTGTRSGSLPFLWKGKADVLPPAPPDFYHHGRDYGLLVRWVLLTSLAVMAKMKSTAQKGWSKNVKENDHTNERKDEH